SFTCVISYLLFSPIWTFLLSFLLLLSFLTAMSLFFSFYCYGHHPDLHSFPTRRSSDLPEPYPLLCHPERSPLLCHPERKKPIRLDRKSTRLNSSHVEISYAVFCLKKKKTRPSAMNTGARTPASHAISAPQTRGSA